MPPLVLFGVFAVLLLLARVCVSAPCKYNVKRLPFIADITHGICPRCGDEEATFKSRPKQYWHQFNCKCGYSLAAHIEEHD
jgi:predicted RNA-binding Zn-ribbon protein involved in translation (DUF1610 family)